MLKALNNSSPQYLKEHILPYRASWVLKLAEKTFLVGPPASEAWSSGGVPGEGILRGSPYAVEFLPLKLTFECREEARAVAGGLEGCGLMAHEANLVLVLNRCLDERPLWNLMNTTRVP